MSEISSPIVGYIRAGLEAVERDDHQAAVEAAEAALGLSPTLPAAVHLLGLVALRMEEPLRAEELFRLAHDLAPGVREHAEALSIASARLGRLHNALFFGKLSTACRPDPTFPGLNPPWLGGFEEALAQIEDVKFTERGLALMAQGSYRAAVEELRKGVEAAPDAVEGWRALRDSLILAQQPFQALLTAQALASMPDADTRDMSRAAEILTEIGRFEEADGCHLAALEEAPLDAQVRSAHVRDLWRSPGADVEAIASAESLYAATFAKGSKPAPRGSGTVTVGVLSGSLRGRREIELIWPAFADHGLTDIRVRCYSNNVLDDALSRRIRGVVDGWVDLVLVDDATAAAIIRNDGVDVLVDLDGFEQRGRLGVIAHRPAPAVLRWHGVPGAAPELYDGVVGSEWTFDGDGPGVVRVRGGHYCPPPEMVAEPPQPVYPGMPVRFGISAPRRVFDAEFFERWSTVRDRAPNARLVVHTDRLGGAAAMDDLDAAVGETGLSDIVFPSTPGGNDRESLHNFMTGIDVYLEVDRINDVAMVWEALTRAKPVLCLSGALPTARAGGSLLNQIGLGDCAVAASDEFVGRVVDFSAGGAAYDEAAHRVHEAVAASATKAGHDRRAAALMQAIVAQVGARRGKAAAG